MEVEEEEETLRRGESGKGRGSKRQQLRQVRCIVSLHSFRSCIRQRHERGKRSERVSRRRAPRQAGEGRTVCPWYACVMACVVVEGETGLLGQQYVPEAQAHRTEGAHVYSCERPRGLVYTIWFSSTYIPTSHLMPPAKWVEPERERNEKQRENEGGSRRNNVRGEGGNSERSSIVCSSGEEERQRCGTSRLDNWYRTWERIVTRARARETRPCVSSRDAVLRRFVKRS